MDLASLEIRLADAFAGLLKCLGLFLQGEKLLILDVGCFPWNDSLELSFLSESDPILLLESAETEIAAWKYFDIVSLLELAWPEGEAAAKVLGEIYREDTSNYQKLILLMLGRALNAKLVRESIESLSCAGAFRVQVLDPDLVESPNYASVKVTKKEP